MDDSAANESWICPHLTVSLTISNDGGLANTINSGGGEKIKFPQNEVLCKLLITAKDDCNLVRLPIGTRINLNGLGNGGEGK